VSGSRGARPRFFDWRRFHDETFLRGGSSRKYRIIMASGVSYTIYTPIVEATITVFAVILLVGSPAAGLSAGGMRIRLFLAESRAIALSHNEECARCNQVLPASHENRDL
jgi:hypothetical protein